MTAAAGFQDVIDKMATRGFFIPVAGAAQGAPTQAAAASAFVSLIPWFQGIGSTLPGTPVGYPRPNVSSDLLLTEMSSFGNQSRAFIAGWIYKIGSLNLAATGDQFTHDAATFPLLRSRMGVAAQPVNLMPFLYTTTATTVTPPQFQVNDVAATQGYVDQDGNTVVGTRTFTMPAAATATASGFMVPLELQDFSVRDIQSIQTTVAGSAGAADVYGFEPICAVPCAVNGFAGMNDLLGEGMAPMDLKPAVATSGTAVAYLGGINFSNGQSANNYVYYMGCLNT